MFSRFLLRPVILQSQGFVAEWRGIVGITGKLLWLFIMGEIKRTNHEKSICGMPIQQHCTNDTKKILSTVYQCNPLISLKSHVIFFSKTLILAKCFSGLYRGSGYLVTCGSDILNVILIAFSTLIRILVQLKNSYKKLLSEQTDKSFCRKSNPLTFFSWSASLIWLNWNDCKQARMA